MYIIGYNRTDLPEEIKQNFDFVPFFRDFLYIHDEDRLNVKGKKEVSRFARNNCVWAAGKLPYKFTGQNPTHACLALCTLIE